MITSAEENILLEKADENFKSADLLRCQKYFNTALNCLYYSVYLKVYRRLLRLNLDTEDNNKGKHKIALDYLYEAAKKNPDASYANMLLTSLKSGRVKASYKCVHISEQEYDRAYKRFKTNKIPLDRFLTDAPESEHGDSDEVDV